MLFKKPKPTNMTNILLVDDDDDLLAIVSVVLKRNGFNVTTASDGVQCLDITRSHRFDLILLDNQMPRMDGQTTLIQLKESRETRDIPVIMVTGQEGNRAMADAQKNGAVDYVVKPFDYAMLLSKISEVLKKRKTSLV